MNTTFYSLHTKTAMGHNLSMKEFEGRPVLIVNTATQCGLAPQFKGLEKLYQNYKDQGLEVLGFPCDQFMGQEPETNETVVEACSQDFGVSFPLMEKSKVNGKDTNEIFKFLKAEKI